MKLLDRLRQWWHAPASTIGAEEEGKKLAGAKRIAGKNFRELWKGVPKKYRPGHRRRMTYGQYEGAWPQIIRSETAARWQKEKRIVKNRIAVVR